MGDDMLQRGASQALYVTSSVTAMVSGGKR